MLHIRKATIDDVNTIQNLANTIWKKHYPDIISREQIDYMLELMYSEDVIKNEINNGTNWFIIIQEKIDIGFISFTFDQTELKVRLNKLYLLNEYHGKGIGQAALKFVIDESRKLSAKYLYLAVNKKNIKAIQAYEKTGFYKHKAIVTDIGNGFVMDDYEMLFTL